MQGICFDIQRYCVSDGPGIRTCVFLKGCPLHCPWCHNPEGLRSRIEQDREGRTYGRVAAVDELIGALDRDRKYYALSGGGVTVTGGEALMQTDFCVALCRACRDRGYDVALETCGNVPQEAIRRVLPYVSRVLFDVKHLDGDKLRAVTGGELALILDNLRTLCRSGIPVTLRCPLIVGFNLEESFLRALGELAAKQDGVTGVELLPYHRLGEDKRRRLGLDTGAYRELTQEEKELALNAVRTHYSFVTIL